MEERPGGLLVLQAARQPRRARVLLRLNRVMNRQTEQMEERAAALLVLQAVRQPRPWVLLRLKRVNQKEEMDKGSCLGHWSRRGLAGVA